MKKIYCKYCGLELERGICTCEKSENVKDTKANQVRCTSCGKNIDEDSKFCPYCGIPVTGDIDKHLEKELKGDYAEDVIAHYGINRKTVDKNGKVVKKKGLGAIGIIIIILVVILALLLVAWLLKPYISTVMTNYQISKLINKDEVETDENEIATGIEPTAGTKKEKNNDGGKSEKDNREEIVDEDGEKNNEGDSVVENNKKNNERIEPTTKKSKENKTLENGGKIKNIDKEKDLYIDDLKECEYEKTIGNNKCTITYYSPIIKGKDSDEAKKATAEFEDVYYGDLGKEITKVIENYPVAPIAIILDTVEQRKINDKTITIMLSGKVVAKDLLDGDVKFRIIYDRNTGMVKEVRNTDEQNKQ